MTRSPLTLLCLAVAVAACQPSAQSAAPAAAAVDTAAVKAGVAELWVKYVAADTSENLDGIVALFADSAQFDTPGIGTLRGHEALKAAWATQYKQRDYVGAEVSPSVTTAVNNDLALQFGSFAERYMERGKKAEMTDHGRYAASFGKGADGQWRLTYGISFIDSTSTKK